MTFTLRQLQDAIAYLQTQVPSYEGEQRVVCVRRPLDVHMMLEKEVSYLKENNTVMETVAEAVLRTEPPEWSPFGPRKRPHPNLQWKLNIEGILLP